MKAYVKASVQTSETVLKSKLDVIERKLLEEIKIIQNKSA